MRIPTSFTAPIIARVVSHTHSERLFRAGASDVVCTDCAAELEFVRHAMVALDASSPAGTVPAEPAPA